MIHASLFSGIGGFDLAAHTLGWQSRIICEINPFCAKTLRFYFPEADYYSDITTTCFKKYKGEIDILSAGFPCQAYSVAGSRKGDRDERHLWPHTIRAIREIRPRWVVGENVQGLINWDDGRIFEQICVDLEAEGYEVLPVVLPARAFGAAHQRNRVFFIAYTRNTRREERDVPTKPSRKGHGTGLGVAELPTFPGRPVESPILSRSDGLPDRLDAITVQGWANASVKAFGNAVVPHVALHIFKMVELYELLY